MDDGCSASSSMKTRALLGKQIHKVEQVPPCHILRFRLSTKR